MTPIYTAEVGRKFYADGRVHPFASTTIIALLAVDAPIVRLGAWLQEQLRQQPFGHKFTLLPLSSLHMTVIQLLNDQDRTPERWTPYLPLDVSMADMCRFLAPRIAAVTPPTNLRMRFTGIKRRGGVAFQLQPADDTVAALLRSYRDAIAVSTGVRLPDHECYQFHISLAYRLLVLTPSEQQALEALFRTAESAIDAAVPTIALPPPQGTVFANMFRFTPLTDLYCGCNENRSFYTSKNSDSHSEQSITGDAPL